MKTIKLTEVQVLTLKSMHRSTKDRKKADRIKTILFLNRWFSMKETSELLMLDEETIRIIKDRFLSDWMDKFLNDSYIIYQGKLTPKQKEEVKIYVRDNTILDSILVIEFIRLSYGIKYTRAGITNLLHSLWFTYKKTKQIPCRASILKQKFHIYKYKIFKIIKAPNEITYFLDWVHPLHNSISSYWWILKWEEKLIKANTWRDRVNINWAFCIENQDIVTVTTDSINTQSTIELYKKLEEKNPDMKTIFVYRDNAKYYANNLIKEYLKTSRIIEIPLPPYSPNLNPIERLWLFMKKNLLYSKYYAHFSDFKEVIRKFFDEDFHLYRDRLKTFITDDFKALWF